MMRPQRLPFLLLALLSSVAAATTGGGPPTYTLGQLVERLARQLALPVSATGPDAAAAALASRGIVVEEELSAPLIEQDLVDLLNQTGMSLGTSFPDRPVGAEKVEIVMRLVRMPPASAPAKPPVAPAGNAAPAAGPEEKPTDLPKKAEPQSPPPTPEG